MDTRNTEFFPISTSVYILQRNTHIWSICPIFKYHNCWMVQWRRKWLEVLFECRAIFTRLDPYVISNNLESTVIVNIRLSDSRETVMTPSICLKHCFDTRRSFNIFSLYIPLTYQFNDTSRKQGSWNLRFNSQTYLERLLYELSHVVFVTGEPV